MGEGEEEGGRRREEGGERREGAENGGSREAKREEIPGLGLEKQPPMASGLSWAGGRHTDGRLWEARMPLVGLDPPRPLEMLVWPSQQELPSGPVGVGERRHQQGSGLRDKTSVGRAFWNRPPLELGTLA